MLLLFAPVFGKKTTASKATMHREAARLLSLILPAIHAAAGDAEAIVIVEVALTVEIFDRLCIWGACREDLEVDDPPEDDCTAEHDPRES